MPSAEATALHAVVVDDEPLARKILREFLSSHPDITVVAECANGFEAVKAITDLKPDLVFLDIQMPKLNGFEVLELVDHQPVVIFVTAYDEYALKAFDVHAADYLLKPFAQSRFDEALEHARNRIGIPTSSPPVVAPRETPVERILVRDGSRVHVIPSEKIDYIEAQDDYICIRHEQTKHLKHIAMATLERDLDPSRFVRIHRSYIINVERVAKIEMHTKDSRVVTLRDGTKLPVSKSGYARLREML